MGVENMAANAEMEESLDQSTEAPLEAEMEEAEAPQENQEESQEETRTDPGDAAGEEENHTQEEAQDNGQDVTQTQAFAHRLREKMEPVEQELQGLRETQSQLESLQEKLKELGYTGTAQDMIDQIEAGRREVSVEQVRRERLEEEAKQQKAIQEAIKKDPEYIRNQQELRVLRERESRRVFEEDMATVRKLNPQEKAQTVQELGPDFMRLRANGIPADVAYKATHEIQPQVEPPKDTGKVKGSQSAAGAYFTPEQVRAMSQAEVNRNLDKIEASMKHW